MYDIILSPATALQGSHHGTVHRRVSSTADHFRKGERALRSIGVWSIGGDVSGCVRQVLDPAMLVEKPQNSDQSREAPT
jgi:hypothetical protein